MIGGINAAIGYGVGVLAGRLFRRLFLSHRDWWPPGPKALYGLKAATVVVSIGASVLMLVPAAAWQRQLSAVMGIEGRAHSVTCAPSPSRWSPAGCWSVSLGLSRTPSSSWRG